MRTIVTRASAEPVLPSIKMRLRQVNKSNGSRAAPCEEEIFKTVRFYCLGAVVHFLNRDSMADVRPGEEPRADAPALAPVERLRPAHPSSDLERAERLRADTAEYAAALKQQLDILVDAYDAAFARWKAERNALQAQVETLEKRDDYIAELERDLLGAWERLETVEDQLVTEKRNGNFYRQELDATSRVAAERERRLTLALFEAQQTEASAVARAEQQVSEAQRESEAAKRRAEEHRQRADLASDERARLAKCYEDACLQASQISKTASAIEHETAKVLAAKDDEIAQLKARYVQLESTLLDNINASIEEARAESRRLSQLVSGVQQGRFWKVKRAAQRMRSLIRR